MQTDPTISRLLMLRSGAIAVQLIAVLSVYFLLEHQIALLPLLVVIAIEAIFQLVSVFAYRNVNAAHCGCPVFNYFALIKWRRNQCVCIAIIATYHDCSGHPS